MKMLKSVGAVIAGFLTVALLSIATDMVLESLKIFPSPSQPQAFGPGYLMIALAYRTLYTVLGGFVTAKLAPSKAMNHVIVLAVLGTVMGTLGAVANWGKVNGQEWYPVALVVLAFPSVWYGGTLFKKKAK